VVLTTLLMLISPSPTRAAIFPVNSGWDINDLEAGNGLCVSHIMIIIPTVLTYCTLRAAVEEANALPGEDTILLGSGTYTISLEGRGEEQAATGDLDITDSVRIIGAGADQTTIDGNSLDRLFDIHGSNIRVTMSNLTLIHGHPGDATSSATGGALRNQGKLILEHVTIRANTAGQGGAIYNASAGDLHIAASTLYDNNSAKGGAIVNRGSANLINTTVADNQAGSLAGALLNAGTCNLIHCTIAENRSDTGGGIVNAGTLTLTNCLLADNQPDNCLLETPPYSRGGNLDSGHSCQLGRLDISGLDPLLGPLADNGGPTMTMALPPESPAVDGGIELDGIVSDQRDAPRPTRRGMDSGAYELSELSIAPCIMPLLGWSYRNL